MGGSRVKKKDLESMWGRFGVGGDIWGRRKSFGY